MTFEQILHQVPALREYVQGMPPDLRHSFTHKVYPPHTIIHQKDSTLESFGIVYRGEHRVINEFENGNIFMIERNEPISFIGEVTLLAGKTTTSVTLETVTECAVLFFSIEDFERWVASDIHFLRLISEKISLKLYNTSYNRGARLFYSSSYMLLRYVLNYAQQQGIAAREKIVVRKTRQELYEEIGMTVKTLGRTIERLRDDGVFTLEKGKIALTRAQYEAALQKADTYSKGKK